MTSHNERKSQVKRPKSVYDDLGFEAIGISDDTMFKSVFGRDPALAGELLSCVLDREVGEVELVHASHELKPDPLAHATTFDVYLRTREGVIGDLEMQRSHKAELPLRMRAHLSNTDRDAIARGMPYEKAPEAWVVFICTFDPLGEGLARYTVERVVRETGERFPDRQAGVLLNATGELSGLPRRLRAFLRYVVGYDGADGIDDDFVREVDERVRATRRDWEWRREYMTLQEMLEDARAEGRAEFEAERREFEAERRGFESTARSLVADGILTPEEAAERFGMPVEEFKAVAEGSQE